MKQKENANLMKFAIAGFLSLVFFYILNVVQPFLYAHHTQAPFLFTSFFAETYFQFPGEPTEYLANFTMQLFYNPGSGAVALFLFSAVFYLLTLALLNRVSKTRINPMVAFLPVTFLVTLVNNYNLPFSVIVSVLLLTSFLLLLSLAKGSLLKSSAIFVVGAFLVYYLSGSGYYLLFTVSSVFLAAGMKKIHKLYFILLVGLFSFVLPFMAAKYIFALPPRQVGFYFYPPEAYFMDYKPSIVFVLFLVSIPVSIVTALSAGYFGSKKKSATESKNRELTRVATGFTVLAIFAGTSHYFSFHPDDKKVVAVDYYCYTNNAEKTAANAKSLEDYNFKANVNYNLVMSKTGQITEKVFDFMQITGSDAIYPDVEFQAEISFVAADFYYNLGFITEARHWAYETLVFYPDNRRTIQLLVKIHLVTGEYTAARQYLGLLKSGFGSKKFIREFEPVVNDSTLFSNYPELVEKRSFIPAEGELSPFIEVRLQQLLAANPQNKRAYEFLMLYYLLESDAEKFIELYQSAGQYFSKVPVIYEEALLTYGRLYEIPVGKQFSISADAKAQFNDFSKNREQYKNSTRTARNKLYKTFGSSYFYFREFVYPNVIKPDIVDDDSDYPAI